MDALTLARWQFGITTVYHFFFVPLTLGLSILVAVMETMYVRTGNEEYKRMTKFWGKLFLINFAMGVVTGIVQEFQFGMNWSQYSRYVGDIFGAPLAIEALLAFFLESTFLGVWIFGWNRLSKRAHCAVMWLVAFGSNLSALFILIANSFMQEPVGYVLRNGRAEMADFFALLTNPHVFVQFPHVFFSGLTTAAFFIVGISAFHLRRRSRDRPVYQKSFRIGMVTAALGSLLVMMVGHTQAQHMIHAQPMKMAAAEAHWDTEDPASWSLFTVGDEKERKDIFAVHIPAMLSFMAYNEFEGEVKGINDLQREYEETYGEGDYVPSVITAYWSFRIMVFAGVLMLGLAGYGLYCIMREKGNCKPRFMTLLIWAIALPYIANTAGWIFTEMGRQPWVVFGLLKTEEAVSNMVSAGSVAASLLAFTLLYGALMGADIFLLRKFAIAGTAGPDQQEG